MTEQLPSTIPGLVARAAGSFAANEALVERVDPKFFGGKATKREVTLRFGPPSAPSIHLLLIVPNNRSAAAPVFVGLNFCGNHTLVHDPAFKETSAPRSATVSMSRSR